MALDTIDAGESASPDGAVAKPQEGVQQDGNHQDGSDRVPSHPQSAKPTIDLELSNPAFNGPLALLLELIEKRRLPITQVSLSQVADQYLERMKTIVGLDPEVLADFLVIAARLLVIKSRELLPTQPAVVEEEGDPAADLERRLIEYRIFKEAAEQLKQMEELGLHSYTRQPSAEPPEYPEPPLAPIPPEALHFAMVRMLKALKPEGERLPVEVKVSVAERIQHLLSVLTSRSSAVFSELMGNSVSEVVATFLALLELLRRGRVVAEQQEAFGEIHITLAQASMAIGTGVA
ncbi:MAG TPA: ScpA family protein [Chloroflexota bacterium]|nr:ScpA family protein [Chloroflexota bacterium]